MRANPTLQAHSSLCVTSAHNWLIKVTHESKVMVQGDTLYLLWEKLQLHSKGHAFREELGIEDKNLLT